MIKADGSTSIEAFKADAKASIDCFYVYPTVSTDPGLLATMAAEPAEIRVVTQQFARFGASCRLFAPLYRQYTLTALAAAMGGHALAGSTGARPMTPYNDVRDAWDYYLAHENHGRGVVLIGHSQGSGMLTLLIKNEIDGKPIQARMVSAILMGTNLVVPKGADVGGDFKNVPLCHGPTQTGCAIAYASFRETSPPPENSRFGRPLRTPGEEYRLRLRQPRPSLPGGAGPPHSYFASGDPDDRPRASRRGSGSKDKTITTPFVSVPGLLTAHCVSTPQFNYLAIHVNADPSSPRTSDINGDVLRRRPDPQGLGPPSDRRQPSHGQSGVDRGPAGQGLDSRSALKLFLLGKRGSIVHWLEDATAAFRSAGHSVEVGIVRRPWLDARLEADPWRRRSARRSPSESVALTLI